MKKKEEGVCTPGNDECAVGLRKSNVCRATVGRWTLNFGKVAQYLLLFSFVLLHIHPCGRGLGLDGLFLNFLKLYSDPHNLVLVLNTSASLEVKILGTEELSLFPWHSSESWVVGPTV